MAEWVGKEVTFSEPDRSSLEAAISSCERPFNSAKSSHGSLEPLRERLYEMMWNKVGIIRDAAGLRSALQELVSLEKNLNETGIADPNRAFNLTWHDWLNLKSLVETSRAIAEAALARSDSRGAHYREDFPEFGPLENSCYTSLQLGDSGLKITMKPVAFTRVRPGQTLLVA